MRPLHSHATALAVDTCNNSHGHVSAKSTCKDSASSHNQPSNRMSRRGHLHRHNQMAKPLHTTVLLLLFLLLQLGTPVTAIKIAVPPGRTECVSETVTPEHFAVRLPAPRQCSAVPVWLSRTAPHAPRNTTPPQVPGGPRIDGRILVSGNSQYYVPFITVRVRHWRW